jgi:sugar phosphate isomerase/epimerase
MGLQLFSVRNELKKDYIGTLEKIASIGYKNLEMAILGADEGLKGNMRASALKRELDRLGMKVVSTHASPLNKILDEVIDYNLELGSEGIAYDMKFFKNKDEVHAFCDVLNEYGERCKAHGLDFYYHNHFMEFQQFGDQLAYDILIENTEKDLVKFEFDSYWAMRGGVDPLSYIKKLGDRCDRLHQKDFPHGAESVNAVKGFGDSEINFDRFMNYSKVDYFTEIGEGIMDIPSIIKTAREVGSAKYIFVEQDYSSMNELESAEVNFKNLSSLLEHGE